MKNSQSANENTAHFLREHCRQIYTLTGIMASWYNDQVKKQTRDVARETFKK